MKKIILLAALAFGSLLHAQDITVVTPGGGTISDGDSFTNSSLDPIANNGPNKVRFNVTNNTEETINVAVRVKSLSGLTVTDDPQTQLCFGVCVNALTQGMLVPDTGFAIDGGATTTGDNHIANLDPGNGTDPVYYNLSFVIVDENMNVLSTPVTFDYTYQPTAGVTGFSALKALGLDVANTVVTDTLNVTATQSATLQLYDVTGKLIKTTAVAGGTQAIDLSALNAALYLARFTTADNKVAQIKIVKN